MALLAERYSQRAEAYDRLWSPAIQPYGERLIASLPLAAADRVIDVGTGAGALLPAIRRAAPHAEVLGVDSSEGMLALARRRHDGPLMIMNAQQLELPGDCFDAALVAFVLFHLPQPSRCLAEVQRVLLRGGSVGTATWGAEHFPEVDSVWADELTAAGAPATPLPAVDNRACCDTEAKVTDLLRDAGFASIRVWTEPLVHRWAPGVHFEHQVLVSSRARLETLSVEQRTRCLEAIRARLASASSDDYVYAGDVTMATGMKP